MNFDSTDLPTCLTKASNEEINKANFGIVEIDNTGLILTYNVYEAELAGLEQGYALGKNLFTEIAPCTNNFMVAEKLLAASTEQTHLDETLDYVFTYKLKPTKVKLRLIQTNNRQWMCVQK